MGEEQEDLWVIFQRIANCNVEEYLVFIIRKLVESLYNNEKTLVYAMEILNTIYSSLKKLGTEISKNYSVVLK